MYMYFYIEPNAVAGELVYAFAFACSTFCFCALPIKEHVVELSVAKIYYDYVITSQKNSFPP